MPRIKKITTDSDSPKPNKGQKEDGHAVRIAAQPMEGITKEEAEEMLRQAWYPLVPAMAKIHAEQALEDSRQGFYVREAIFDRLYDKPRIKVDSTEHKIVTLVIRPYSDNDNGLTGEAIEGEARVLDVSLPEPQRQVEAERLMDIQFRRIGD